MAPWRFGAELVDVLPRGLVERTIECEDPDGTSSDRIHRPR